MVHFTVSNISILSPQNKTYTTSNVPLLFEAHVSFTQIAYTLDGQKKVTVSENTTLTDIPNGDHNVTLYLTDEAGNTGVSETIYFIVETPFPATMVIAPIPLVVVFGLVLRVYFKKRKR